MSVPGATNLAGVTYDENRELLYATDRNSNHLFVYQWDAENKELTLQGGTYKELDYGGAMGLAFDETTDILYVTNASSTVHTYDASDPNWPHIDNINVGRAAYDIDVDPDADVLYTGGYVGHTYLVKTDLNDPNDSEELDIGAGVIGLAVDHNTGLVYTTTYHNQLRVYDPSVYPFILTDSENISAGAGVCVPNGELSYKPWLWDSGDTNIYFYKEDAIENSNSCVDPTDTSSDEITYTIYFGNAVDDPNDPNYVGNMTNVVITDYLALEILADPNQMTISDDGTYDYETNTITWETGTLTAGATDSVSFTVKVTTMAEPMGTVDNYVEFETDKYFTTDTTETPVCCWGVER
ncbi:MAG: VCBS domain-containing protein [Deltaproteobacteria bacterium]|nr:VCBS domain-containing protein [Deltaproteobacteria bacterium]